jgi:Tfp pilus assembly protein PilV
MPLTRALLIEGLVAGLIIGIALPSLIKLWSVVRVNAAIARAEQRLRAAMPKAGPPPQSTPEPPQP